MIRQQYQSAILPSGFYGQGIGAAAGQLRSNEADSGTAESPVFAPGKNGPYGASIPMPSIINPLNNDEYKKERDKDKKEPGFETVKWASASVNENEEVELSASVKDIEDDNMVTLQVFPEGKGPEDGAAIASFPCKVTNGSVSAKWKYKGNDREVPPDDDPKFVFSAHSAWCNFKKSSNTLTVKLTRPEVTKAEWKDSEGSSISTALVGQTIKLYAEVKNVEGSVTFNVFDDKKKCVAGYMSEIKDGKAEAEWTYNYEHNSENPLKEKPKFTFEVVGQRCKKVESPSVEMGINHKVTVHDENGDLAKNRKYYISYSDGTNKKYVSDENGVIELKNIIPGVVTEIIEDKNDSPGQIIIGDDDE
ncbi:MAG: hypothetical protein K6E97_11080 [Treponema sp.]|nr:hypothetical protein [Treponema sp.]